MEVDSPMSSTASAMHTDNGCSDTSGVSSSPNVTPDRTSQAKKAGPITPNGKPNLDAKAQDLLLQKCLMLKSGKMLTHGLAVFGIDLTHVTVVKVC